MESLMEGWENVARKGSRSIMLGDEEKKDHGCSRWESTCVTGAYGEGNANDNEWGVEKQERI